MSEQAKKRCEWPGCGAEMIEKRDSSFAQVLGRPAKKIWWECPNADQHKDWTCPDCGGGGQVNFTETNVDDCSRCGGVGYVRESERNLSEKPKVLSAKERLVIIYDSGMGYPELSDSQRTVRQADDILRMEVTIKAEKERADKFESITADDYKTIAKRLDSGGCD